MTGGNPNLLLYNHPGGKNYEKNMEMSKNNVFSKVTVSSLSQWFYYSVPIKFCFQFLSIAAKHLCPQCNQ